MIQHGPPAANTRARTHKHTHARRRTHADKGVKLFTREEQTLNMCRRRLSGGISAVSNHSNRHQGPNQATLTTSFDIKGPAVRSRADPVGRVFHNGPHGPVARLQQVSVSGWGPRPSLNPSGSYALFSAFLHFKGVRN